MSLSYVQTSHDNHIVTCPPLAGSSMDAGTVFCPPLVPCPRNIAQPCRHVMRTGEAGKSPYRPGPAGEPCGAFLPRKGTEALGSARLRVLPCFGRYPSDL